MLKELEYPTFSLSSYRRISWGAVFAGAITSLSTLVVMTTLGAALGWAGALREGQALTRTLSMGAVLWLPVSAIVSFYAGGWVAGRLTEIARVSESVIHGVASWSVVVVTLAFVFTASTVGGLGLISRSVGAGPSISVPADPLDLATENGNMGVAAGLSFLALILGAAAAGLGARSGTRVLRPVPALETRRERVVS